MESYAEISEGKYLLLVITGKDNEEIRERFNLFYFNEDELRNVCLTCFGIKL